MMGGAWAAKAALAFTIALGGFLAKASAACAKTHPYVGFMGDLTMMDHNVRPEQGPP